MLRAPAFWQKDGALPRLLAPLSFFGAAMTARRVARPGWRAPVPVICCGNVTVGGAGKTTVAIDLARRLIDRRRSVHILLRGYKGSAAGPRQVGPGDTADVVGDEALLLAAVAPTWTGSDRAASARAAIAMGADVLLMDDGLQNPGLLKDLALLVVDGTTGFGNARVLPAGPLREPVAAGAARSQAAVFIGPDLRNAGARLPPTLPVLTARLVQGPEIDALVGRRILPFAGIATPAKFFKQLEAAGAILVDRIGFPDHHPFTERELSRLMDRARTMDAIPVTTPKDAVRLTARIRDRVRVVGVGLAWDDPAAIDTLVSGVIAARALSAQVEAPKRL